MLVLVRLTGVKALFIHSSLSLINEEEKRGAGGKELRGRETMDRRRQTHDSSYAALLEMKRRKWSKYEEKNETPKGRKGVKKVEGTD